MDFSRQKHSDAYAILSKPRRLKGQWHLQLAMRTRNQVHQLRLQTILRSLSFSSLYHIGSCFERGSVATANAGNRAQSSHSKAARRLSVSFEHAIICASSLCYLRVEYDVSHGATPKVRLASALAKYRFQQLSGLRA